MKYKVLETCHAGGRMCRKGQVVEFKDAVDNKYLEKVSNFVKVTKKKEGQALRDLSKKTKSTTGMSAKRKIKQEDE